MNATGPRSYSSFEGHRRLETGPLALVALAAKHANERGTDEPVLIFDDRTGRSIDIDTRGSDAEVMARFAAQEDGYAADELTSSTSEPRGRGRPKLGVVAREVTLLPRHWEWLATQSGGASVAIRKLVDQARQSNSERDTARHAQERAYYFMSAIAGDMSGFEEAARALFANEMVRFRELIANWPADIRDHVIWLANVERA